MKKLCFKFFLLVFVTIGLFYSCERDFPIPSANNYIKILKLQDSVTANGIDYYTIQVSLIDSTLSLSGPNTVSFSCESGVTLSPINGGKFDQYGNAYVNVFSEKSGNKYVWATLNDVTVSIIVDFYPSYPDKMRLYTDKTTYTFEGNSYLAINMKASFSLNNGGKITDYPKEFLTISALDSLGNSVGEFINGYFDSNLMILNSSLYLVDSTFNGRIEVLSNCVVPEDTLNGSCIIYLTK